MNEGDYAERAQSTFLEAAIKTARSQGRALLPKGRCYFCDESITKPKLFCDGDCATDHEKLNRNKR